MRIPHVMTYTLRQISIVVPLKLFNSVINKGTTTLSGSIYSPSYLHTAMPHQHTRDSRILTFAILTNCTDAAHQVPAYLNDTHSKVLPIDLKSLSRVFPTAQQLDCFICFRFPFGLCLLELVWYKITKCILTLF